MSSDDASIHELRLIVAKMRKVAEPIGPLHSFWDFIGDAESLIHGRRGIVLSSISEAIAECSEALRMRAAPSPQFGENLDD